MTTKNHFQIVEKLAQKLGYTGEVDESNIESIVKSLAEFHTEELENQLVKMYNFAVRQWSFGNDGNNTQECRDAFTENYDLITDKADKILSYLGVKTDYPGLYPAFTITVDGKEYGEYSVKNAIRRFNKFWKQGRFKMITNKIYICPLCKDEKSVATNHNGEIYSSCKVCGCSVRYCKDNQPKENKTLGVIHTYNFNFDNPGDYDKYSTLCLQLESRNFKIFCAFGEFKEWERIQKLDGQETGFYRVGEFENQVVSDIGRAFYWSEFYWTNQRIKSGYYIELG